MTDKSISEYMAANGSKGGKAKTRAKAETARANGKKGGRPRKHPGLNKEAVKAIEAQIIATSPEIILGAAPSGRGIVVSVKRPDYKNDFAGEWKDAKRAFKKQLKPAIQKLLPQGSVITMIMREK